MFDIFFLIVNFTFLIIGIACLWIVFTGLGKSWRKQTGTFEIFLLLVSGIALSAFGMVMSIDYIVNNV